MHVQREYSYGATLELRNKITHNSKKNHLSLHCRFRQSIPRRNKSLPSHVIHPRQRSIRRHQIGKKSSPLNGQILYRMSHSRCIIPAPPQYSLQGFET